ncbi:3,4-dihydroxy-2-butanone 4-phosphate synthase / GTP cyclohydrolase II [hydrothermal vent metagenome]|uniref:GTP cyclohydrolase II n=1 Tax=hydrothermal vent metagenome TaxID=652676 RepID=A0A3B0T6D0_9ZZZZ
MNTERVRRALDAMRNGEFVLVVDDEHRENEGDLILAAEMATAEAIAFMVRHTSGLICVPTTGERLDALGLPLMVIENTDTHETAFTVSVDAAFGDMTTGISASDRATTIRALADSATRPDQLTRPGHIFPLRYAEGGVLVRPGHTEAAVDLARLAGLAPTGVVCEIVNEDGSMSRGPELEAFADRHGITRLSIAELVDYRWATESLVEHVDAARLPTAHGEFIAHGYRAHDGSEHIALVLGDVAGAEDVLVRLHSECLTGDVFGSNRCDCGAQLNEALRLVGKEGAGVIVYNRRHEGRGIGLLQKLAAYRLQDEGMDTVEANIELGHKPDMRHYGNDAQILHDLKLDSVRLLTNNPDKVAQLEAFGVRISKRLPLVVGETPDNKMYLRTKSEKLGHLLDGGST